MYELFHRGQLVGRWHMHPGEIARRLAYTDHLFEAGVARFEIRHNGRTEDFTVELC